MKASHLINALGLSFLVTTSAVWSANVSSSPVAPSIREQAKIKQVKADFESMQVALAMYKLNAGVYPTAEQGLKSLVTKPDTPPVPRRWAMMLDAIPKDPWDRDYRYVVRETDGKITHVLICDGPDLLDQMDNIEQILEAKR